jgi:hypothetical protein
MNNANSKPFTKSLPALRSVWPRAAERDRDAHRTPVVALRTSGSSPASPCEISIILAATWIASLRQLLLPNAQSPAASVEE